MSIHTNPHLANAAKTGTSPVINAIKNASIKTGVDFDYLVNQAKTESSLNPTVKAKTSSATGLYQFIDRTWLNMVKQHGAKYGLGDMAAHIDGQGRVANAGIKQKILNLRKDPQISSYMAAEFAKQNQNHLQNTVGGAIGQTDLYMAHFLGAGGAEDFLTAWKDNPNQSAADIMPRAAAANKNVFYDRTTGAKKSLDDVYQYFAAKFDDAPSNATNVITATTSNPAPRPTSTSPVNNTIDPMVLLAAMDSDTVNLINTAGGLTRGEGTKKSTPNPSLMRLTPKTTAPMLSPYTNMVMAALDTPFNIGEGRKSVWFSKE